MGKYRFRVKANQKLGRWQKIDSKPTTKIWKRRVYVSVLVSFFTLKKHLAGKKVSASRIG